MSGTDVKYDVSKRDRALKAAALRGVVAGYFVYLGYKIATAKDTTMSPLACKLFGLFFVLAAVGFGVYIVMRLKADMAAARETPDADKDTSPQDPGTEENDT